MVISSPVKYYSLFFFIFLAGLIPCGCLQNTYTGEFYRKFTCQVFPYNIGMPDKSISLPSSLEEISALEYFRDGMLACVEDENGILYLVDSAAGKIIQKIKFGKKGDYEANAISGDTAWVIKSNGQLFRFRTNGGESSDPVIFDLPLKSKNNIEGMCYKPDDNSLLIACKDEAGIESKMAGRAVYRFDIATGKLDIDPFLHITNKYYMDMLDSNGLNLPDHTPFKPSGIAIHPSSGYIYLISSLGKLLIVIDDHKKIISMVPLTRKIFQQPEGICFSPEGDMFISSEGENKAGYIYRFNHIR